MVSDIDHLVNQKGEILAVLLKGAPHLLMLLVLLVGCGPANVYIEPPPPEVTVATPVTRSVTEYLEFTGVTQPVESVDIRARVKGFLKERLFVEGAEVKKGQLLLVIDEATFQIQLESAETRLQEAEAALQQATESKAREVAKAQVALSESQLQLSQQEEERIRNLFSRQVSTQADIDQMVATRKMRGAEAASDKAKLEQAIATYETAILTCRAQLASAKIAVRNAELDLSYCRMTAPIDGRISQVRFDVGNLVGDGESTVLATIVKMDPIYAYATVSEADLVRAPMLVADGKAQKTGEAGVPVELGLSGGEGYPYQGKIDYSDPSLDAGTGTLRTRGIFTNSDRALLPGMFVRMRVAVRERADAILVPERALGTDQSGQFLLVVGADGIVQARIVKVGVSIDDLRVVEGPVGLQDQVIVDGLLRARPGAKVTPKTQTAPPVAASAAVSGRL